MLTSQQGELTFIGLTDICRGNNPRNYFDPAEMAELTASVAANGVVQPIVVRPVEGGGYMLIAGERRFRAAVEAFGMDNYAIPAFVKNVTDEEAEVIALAENATRADMSISEEAVAAGKILDRLHGNRDEAAASLGWPLSKLNRRIGLLNLIPDARTALDERRILIGHAELLAAIPQDKQPKALAMIVEHQPTVQKVKELLVGVSTDFKIAIFDLAAAGCTQCQYNSERQGALFVDAIEGGHCTNKECFEAKTAEKVEALRVELTEEYQTVRVLQVGENGFCKLTAEGRLGVGQEQMDACKACSHFGATVSNLPGEEGKIEREVCFQPDCMQGKVAERIKAEKEKAKEKQKPTAPTAAEAGATEATPTEGADSGSTTTASPKATSKTAKEAPKAKVAALSAKVVEYRREVWIAAAKKELRAAPDKARALVLDLLLTGDGNLVNREKLVGFFNKVTGANYPSVPSYDEKKTGHPEIPHSLSDEQQGLVFAAAAISAVGNASFKDARLQALHRFLATDLTQHFTLGEELLNLLTKSEIESVCVSLGIDGHVNDWKKVIGGKKDEAIKAILAAPFEFTGAIPSFLNY